MHLLRAFGFRVTEGGKADKSHARLEPQIARNRGSAFGDVGQIILVRPFLHQRIGDEHDTPLVQQGGDASDPMFGIGIKDVVDQFQDIGRFPRRPGDQTIAMAMRQHERGKNMAVAAGQPVDVVPVEPFALQTVVKIIAVLLQVWGIGRVDDFQFGHGIGHACGSQLGLDILLATDDQCLAHARPLILHGRAQDTQIVALGKDHGCLSMAGPRADRAHDAGRGVHAGLQRRLIGFHILDHPAGGAGFHAGLGHGGRYHVDQPRIEGCRNDVIAPEGQLAPISHVDLIGHIQTGQRGKRLGAGDLHLVIDGAGMHVQCSSEQVGKTKDVVYLIGIIAAPRRHDGIRAHGMRILGGDLGVGIGHGEYYRIGSHAGHHFRRHRALG